MFAPWLLVPLLLIANQGTLKPPAVVVACGFGRKILPKRWASCLMSPMGWSWLRRKALICDSLTQQPDWIGHLIAPDMKHHLDSRWCAIRFGVGCNGRSTGHHLLFWLFCGIPDHSKTSWVPVLSGPWCSVLQVKAPSGTIVGWDLNNDVGLSHAKNGKMIIVFVYILCLVSIYIYNQLPTTPRQFQRFASCASKTTPLYTTLCLRKTYIWIYIGGNMKSWYHI